MGIKLLQGRYLRDEDSFGEEKGVIINRTLAEKCWPGLDPIGRRVEVPSFKGAIVGVVEDVRQWGTETPSIPEVYFPDSFDDTVVLHSSDNLVIRTSIDGHKLFSSLQATMIELDKDSPLLFVKTMKDILRQSTTTRRLLTQAIFLFMNITLILGLVGVYGTVSYTIMQKRREIGIRMATGAMPHHIIRFVFRMAMSWILAGMGAGVILTVSISSVYRSVVYGIDPLNPVLLLAGLIAVGITSFIACFIPARRAARIDPMEALRCK